MDAAHEDPGMSDDVRWFVTHGERLTRIRTPWPGEMAQAFEVLGMHDRARRRILTWKAPNNGVLFRVPFVAHADETIENEDEVLIPILDQMMAEAAKKVAN